MDGEVAEVHLALEIVERPRRVGDAALMPRVGADRRVAVVHRHPGLILNLADEAAAAAHHEPAVPLVGQEQGEVNLAADDAVHAAMRDANGAGRRRRHRGRLRHLHIRQLQHRQVRALGVIGRADGRREQTCDGDGRKQSCLHDEVIIRGNRRAVTSRGRSRFSASTPWRAGRGCRRRGQICSVFAAATS